MNDLIWASSDASFKHSNISSQEVKETLVGKREARQGKRQPKNHYCDGHIIYFSQGSPEEQNIYNLQGRQTYTGCLKSGVREYKRIICILESWRVQSKVKSSRGQCKVLTCLIVVSSKTRYILYMVNLDWSKVLRQKAGVCTGRMDTDVQRQW